MHKVFLFFLLLALLTSCSSGPNTSGSTATTMLKPIYVTEALPHDTDDPAIWIHPSDPALSLVVGTDKAETDGGLYVFDLKGKIVTSVRGLDRPNNVDIVDGVITGGDTFSIAVCSERMKGQMRAFRLPEMTPVDGGGLPVFEGEANREVMGIALYRRPVDGAIFAIVSRKTETGDPADSAALWQYRLLPDSASGLLKAVKVRQFGNFSGKKEIEAIAVDDALSYVYYSDEQVGVRQYHADPDQTDNRELALFAAEGFTEDHEGISIYPTGVESGYILVSDQAAGQFHIFTRAGTQHELLGIVKMSTVKSDGSEVTAVNLNTEFPEGLFVAMSDDRTFHYYDWREIRQSLNVPQAEQTKP